MIAERFFPDQNILWR